MTSPKLNVKGSPKPSHKNKNDKKKSNDKKDKEIDKNDDKESNKTNIEKPLVVEKIVDSLQSNSIKLFEKANDGSNEMSNVAKIKNAFELLMEKGDTPRRKTPLKRKLKRCDGPTDGQTRLMDKWLRK